MPKNTSDPTSNMHLYDGEAPHTTFDFCINHYDFCLVEWDLRQSWFFKMPLNTYTSTHVSFVYTVFSTHVRYSDFALISEKITPTPISSSPNVVLHFQPGRFFSSSKKWEWLFSFRLSLSARRKKVLKRPFLLLLLLHLSSLLLGSSTKKDERGGVRRRAQARVTRRRKRRKGKLWTLSSEEGGEKQERNIIPEPCMSLKFPDIVYIFLTSEIQSWTCTQRILGIKKKYVSRSMGKTTLCPFSRAAKKAHSLSIMWAVCTTKGVGIGRRRELVLEKPFF